jgi:hypothetical protein
MPAFQRVAQNYIGGEEYEEILAFYPPDARFRRWTMWRSNEDIVVQSTVGHMTHFTSVAGALDSLSPHSRRNGRS